MSRKKYRRVMSIRRLRDITKVKCPKCRELLEPVIGRPGWYYIVCPECNTLWKGDGR